MALSTRTLDRLHRGSVKVLIASGIAGMGLTIVALFSTLGGDHGANHSGDTNQKSANSNTGFAKD